MIKRILFICHGNICRSPMAEFVMKDMVEKHGLSHWVEVASAATSTEELGNPVHPGTRRKLSEHGISCKGKTARQVTREDYQDYDLLIGMDEWNMKNLRRLFPDDPEHKLVKLLSLCGDGRDVADPWYTGDFEATWQDVNRGCEALLEQLIKEGER
ncbi:MAG: low molecular weight phosphotyrosine protein phosphatase [Clostridiales bacterium]|nr:low molecular weight phosphotyrosine protein phosphatase [Clostridiales bacterium]